MSSADSHQFTKKKRSKKRKSMPNSSSAIMLDIIPNSSEIMLSQNTILKEKEAEELESNSFSSAGSNSGASGSGVASGTSAHSTTSTTSTMSTTSATSVSSNSDDALINQVQLSTPPLLKGESNTNRVLLQTALLNCSSSRSLNSSPARQHQNAQTQTGPDNKSRGSVNSSPQRMPGGARTPSPRSSKFHASPESVNLSRTQSKSPRTPTTPRTPRTPGSVDSSPRAYKPYSIFDEPIVLRNRLGRGAAAQVYEASVSGLIVAAKIYHEHYENNGYIRKTSISPPPVSSSASSTATSGLLSKSNSYAHGDKMRQPNDHHNDKIRQESTMESFSEERDLIENKLMAVLAMPPHPNVIRLYSYRFVDNQLIVLMEKLDGNLRELINQRRFQYYGFLEAEPDALDMPPFNKAEIKTILRQIAKGLAHLHLLPHKAKSPRGGTVQGLIHRDLKSENIFFSILPNSEQPDLRVISSSSMSCSSSSDVEYRSSSPCFELSSVDNSSYSYSSGDKVIRQESSSFSLFSSPKRRIHKLMSPSQEKEQSKESMKAVVDDADNEMQRYCLKIGDLPDEAHIMYDLSDPESPIKWIELSSKPFKTSFSSPNFNTNPDSLLGASKGTPVGLGRKKTMLSASRERLSLNVGTLQFMAPEMASYHDTYYNEKVDIWSFGMIMYEILTLELPYGLDNYTVFELYEIIQNGVRPTIPEGYLHTEEWSDILALFNDCTQLDAKKRPSAQEILRRL